MTSKNPHRISFDEALALYCDTDIESLKIRAHDARARLSGDRVTWSNTLYLYPTNMCQACCPMCAFYAIPGTPRAWFRTPQEIVAQISPHTNLSEVHIVGGLHRACSLDYYAELFSLIRATWPHLHIKALTAAEIAFIADLESLSEEEVLRTLQKKGLSSMPGGGAEILDDEIRKIIATKKIASDRWLSIHRQAHGLGIPTNATMLFGHIEEPKHIISHLLKIRSLQDETGGFGAFVPLKYHPENNALGQRAALLRPKDIRRIFALSRLVLDNIPTIKVLWNYVGIDEALELLDWGASDFSSTHIGEQVVTSAGGQKIAMTEERLENLLRNKGRYGEKICAS